MKEKKWKKGQLHFSWFFFGKFTCLNVFMVENDVKLTSVVLCCWNRLFLSAMFNNSPFESLYLKKVKHDSQKYVSGSLLWFKSIQTNKQNPDWLLNVTSIKNGNRSNCNSTSKMAPATLLWIGLDLIDMLAGSSDGHEFHVSNRHGQYTSARIKSLDESSRTYTRLRENCVQQTFPLLGWSLESVEKSP